MNRLARHLTNWIWLLAAVAGVLYYVRAYLEPGMLPERGSPGLPFQGSDLTPCFWPLTLNAIRALWNQGTLAFWNPYMMAGGPQFALPGAGVLSLATLLGGAMAPDAALRASMVLHVVAGVAGTYALARELKVDRPWAAVGGFAFALGAQYLHRVFIGHLNIAYALSLMPWVFLAAWKAVAGPRIGWRWALAAGALVGVQVLEGGDMPLLYEAVALALLAVGVVLGPDRCGFALRLGVAGVVIATCALALSLHQLLPMLDFMARAGRQGGLSFDIAKSYVEGRPVFYALPLVAMLAAGALTLFVRGPRRAALWLAAVLLLGWAIARYESVFGFFFKVVPGFNYMRIPSRALMLVAVVAPVLWAACLQGVASLLARAPPRARWISIGAAAVLAVFLARQVLADAPKPPRMARVDSTIVANASAQWLKARADGTRVHNWESRDRHWSADNVTLPLGLEPITSYEPTEHHDYLPSDFDPPHWRTFISESVAHPAKLWGLLNVRYVTSLTPREAPGFHLAAKVEPCPREICQPEKAAGSYIYENDKWMPRAWRVPRAVVIVGPSRAAFEASLDILEMDEFDPRRAVVLQIEPGEALPAPATVSAGAGIEGVPRWGTPEARQAVLEALKSVGDGGAGGEQTGGEAAEVRRIDVNRMEVRAPGSGWLVVSERLKLFPGWSAESGGADVPIYRADGVLAAMPLGENRGAKLRYRPTGLASGACVLLLGALSVGVIAGVRGRRARRTIAEP